MQTGGVLSWVFGAKMGGQEVLMGGQEVLPPQMQQVLKVEPIWPLKYQKSVPGGPDMQSVHV